MYITYQMDLNIRVFDLFKNNLWETDKVRGKAGQNLYIKYTDIDLFKVYRYVVSCSWKNIQ